MDGEKLEVEVAAHNHVYSPPHDPLNRLWSWGDSYGSEDRFHFIEPEAAAVQGS